ncbi:MAG: HAMP domain-containing histidine kinase, partial [candidate division Zixibacteria bacterium]|nr:HAMP domain-containing histidine kinase [candidate division Zixibacteria bacterium]
LGSDHCPAVHVLCNDFRVRVFDTSLTLLAQSEPCLIERIWAKSRLPGGDSILFCGDGIYTTDLKRIAYYPGGSQCEPLTFDDHGGVLTVLLQSGPRMMLARLEERGFLDLAVIFYVNNKAYFLMIVSGLVVGLLAMNYYRRRSQRNLVLIASQKKELEETHAALKRAQAQLVAQAKYEQAQDIAGGVAHEIRNALSPARNALGRILVDLDARKIDPDTLTRLTDLSERSVARAVDLTRLISEYSRLDTKIEELPVSPAAIMAEVLEAYREEADEARVRIQADIPPHATVPGNKDQLSIVFVNLLRNALEALAGRTDPRLTISGEDTGHDLLITVTDNGPGIAPDTIDRVFEIFYSTKPSTGTGVGLAMTRRILELYGGTISAANAPTGGAVFCLRLPTIS